MDYQKLFRRGSRYVNDAGWNWTKRKDKLIHTWVQLGRGFGKTIKQRRINELIEQLNTRINTLVKMIYQNEEILRIKNSEAGETIVELQCDNCLFNPNATGIGIKYKDYEDGKYSCNICGRPLKLREDSSIKRMLYSVGIR